MTRALLSASAALTALYMLTGLAVCIIAALATYLIERSAR